MTRTAPQTDLQRALSRAARLGARTEPTTASEPVSETDNATLHRYGNPDHPPLVIVYSLVNRPAILDLSPERSVIRRLTDGGYCAYLIAWHPPGVARRYLGLADYILGDIADAVAWVSRRHGAPPHLLGVCQGGVLALCHAALAPASVRSLTTLATPVDTGTANDRLAELARRVDFDDLVAATGNVTGPGLATVFACLKPFALGPQRYGSLAALADADDDELDAFMRMERWMYDGPDLAGRAFAEFARDVYQHNALVHGRLVLDGQPVHLGDITAPVFNAWAEHDHLVPPDAARALSDHLAGACETQSIPGGHLGLFIGGRAHKMLYPVLIEWLRSQ
ncbi:alpha/beta fold hydrolase [Spiribacter insolitus]|uniref:Alpha/beta fold hydrolase n=1 Tax=Spiribacter insolitus TaxID=3122417 RepID=A0ABV3TAR6_9GAMM